MSEIRRNLRNTLQALVDAMDAETTTLTEDEMGFILDTLRQVTEDKMSKYQAARYLNMTVKRFDYLLGQGRLPKGHKQTGFKELFWLKSELKRYIER